MGKQVSGPAFARIYTPPPPLPKKKSREGGLVQPALPPTLLGPSSEFFFGGGGLGGWVETDIESRYQGANMGVYRGSLGYSGGLYVVTSYPREVFTKATKGVTQATKKCLPPADKIEPFWFRSELVLGGRGRGR